MGSFHETNTLSRGGPWSLFRLGEVAPWGGEWGGKRSGCCSEKEKGNFFKEGVFFFSPFPKNKEDKENIEQA